MVIENQIPKTETVYELKDEYKTPSFEEFMKTYESDDNLNYDDLGGGDIGESKGYGPCKNSLCGCSCLSEDCACGGGVKSFININDGFRIANVSAFGRKEDESEVGWNSRSGEFGSSAIRVKDWSGDAKFLSVSAGGKIVDENNVKLKLGVDAVNFKTDGVQARVGLNADTGFSNGSDGVEVKIAGFGATLGNQIGISTPVGEIKVDKDKCVVQ